MAAKEQGIIFKGDMIRALIAGRKKRTRRLNVDYWMGLGLKPGDRLWSRETLVESKPNSDGETIVLYAADHSPVVQFYDDREEEILKPWPEEWYGKKTIPTIHMPRWASRIILEVTASTRRERLNDITPEEAILEGAYSDVLGRWTMFDPFPKDRMYHSATPPAAFAMYVNYIHGGKNWHRKPSGLWTQNPEVAVISFELVKGCRAGSENGGKSGAEHNE